MTAFLHGQSKTFIIFRKRIFKRPILWRLRNLKALSKDKRYLLKSYNINDVTECAPIDDNGNVTLIAQGPKQDFILHFASSLVKIPTNRVRYLYPTWTHMVKCYILTLTESLSYKKQCVPHAPAAGDFTCYLEIRSWLL